MLEIFSKAAKLILFQKVFLFQHIGKSSAYIYIAYVYIYMQMYIYIYKYTYT